jgi:hypothetical protein
MHPPGSFKSMFERGNKPPFSPLRYTTGDFRQSYNKKFGDIAPVS